MTGSPGVEVGPYRLSRRDYVVASWVLGFKLGSRKARIRSWLVLVVPLVAVAIGLVTGDSGLAGWSVFLLVVIFLVAPALRKGETVTLSIDPHGVHRRVGPALASVDWSGVGTTAVRAGKLFIMVTPDCAAIVPARAVPTGLLDELRQAVEAFRPA